jgi:beta-mannosidase
VYQGHDAHNWQVWHGGASFRTYQQEPAHFLSEFGLQALPHPDTLIETLAQPDDSGNWSSHHGDVSKLNRYSKLMSDQPPLPGDRIQFAALFEQFSGITVYQSQLAQAVALQTAIEHMRRRRPETGGLCVWQFNEPWPAISWAIVDYFGRPKLAFHRLLTWYNPVLVSVEFPVGQAWTVGDIFRARLWLINDGLTSFGDCQLQIYLDQQLVHNQTVDAPANQALAVGEMSCKLQTKPSWLEASLTHRENVLSRNFYPLRWSDTTTPGVGQRLRRWVARLALR